MKKGTKRLYVIGNGFDIFHRRKTSYHDFRRFLINRGYSSFMCSVEHNRDDFEDGIWNDVELSMGQINVDAAFSLMLDYGADNWKDSANYDCQYELELSTNFINELPNYLREWIKDIESEPLLSAKKNPFTYEDRFLVFNYTNTLEDVYHVHPNQILHIHGSYKNGDQLIMGQTLMSSSDIDTHEDDDPRIIESIQILDEYYEQSFKHINDIIKKNQAFFNKLNIIDEIFLLGNSISWCDWVDSKYYQYLYSCLPPDCTWYVSYYGDTVEEAEKDKEKKYEGLLFIGVDLDNIEFGTVKGLMQKDRQEKG